MAASKDHVSARERRVDERYVIQLEAIVRAYRMPTVAVVLRDISAGGAMLEADARPYGIGEEVTFSARKLELVATIAWMTDDFFGLAFHRRLDPHEIDLLRKADRG